MRTQEWHSDGHQAVALSRVKGGAVRRCRVFGPSVPLKLSRAVEGHDLFTGKRVPKNDPRSTRWQKARRVHDCAVHLAQLPVAARSGGGKGREEVASGLEVRGGARRGSGGGDAAGGGARCVDGEQTGGGV